MSNDPVGKPTKRDDPTIQKARHYDDVEIVLDDRTILLGPEAAESVAEELIRAIGKHPVDWDRPETTICFECMAVFGVVGRWSNDRTDSATHCPFCGHERGNDE